MMHPERSATATAQQKGVFIEHGFIHTPVGIVVHDLFNQPPRFEEWAWQIPTRTIEVLESLSKEADIAKIYASGTIVRAYRQGPIPAHNEVSAKIYYPTQLDGDDWLKLLNPLQLQAVSTLYSGQYDSDWRLALHSKNPKRTLAQIARRLRTSGTTKLFNLDNELPCLFITYVDGRRIQQRYQVAVTPVPTTAQLTDDWRMGKNQSRRMNQLVEVVRYNGTYYFIEDLATHHGELERIKEPEQIEDPKCVHLGQVVGAGLRTIRGNIDAERSLDRTASSDIPIEELVAWDTIMKYRLELRRHLALFRQGKQQLPADFRIEEIIREGMLITIKNPIRTTLLLCALGILDVFVPEANTLDEDYDVRQNPLAHEIIGKLTWPKDTPAFPQPYAYLEYISGDGPGRIGPAFFLEALYEMGLMPMDVSWLPNPFGRPNEINPFAAAIVFDLREAMGRT